MIGLFLIKYPLTFTCNFPSFLYMKFNRPYNENIIKINSQFNAAAYKRLGTENHRFVSSFNRFYTRQNFKNTCD